MIAEVLDYKVIDHSTPGYGLASYFKLINLLIRYRKISRGMYNAGQRPSTLSAPILDTNDEN